MNNSGYALLVVDDNEINRTVLARRLQQQGYDVSTAASGSEALQMLQDRPFDLVLLDVMMPDVDGLEVLTILRETHSLVDLPVILVTARDQSGDVVAALQLGANDYVTKPLNFPVVLARVQTQLSIRHMHLQKCLAEQSVGSPETVLDPAAGARQLSSALATVIDHPNKAGACAEVDFALATTREWDLASGSTGREAQMPVGPKARAKPRPVLADYEILEELGRGGMGVVYKARHQRMNRIVAVKVIDRHYLAHPHGVRRFYQEIQAAAQLSHPNIVMAYDARQVGETHFLAMEYVEGDNLDHLVRDAGPLPVGQACEYIRQTALGLQHIHERNLVHRDIKPSNLLVTWCAKAPPVSGAETRPTGLVKILDLGLALLRDSTERLRTRPALTGDGRVVGTADFMAPEQGSDSHHVDIRADLYSLGCTLYYLLAGEVPFPEGDSMEKLFKHRFANPVPIEQLQPDVPSNVASMLARLMAKRPEERYQTPAELLGAFE